MPQTYNVNDHYFEWLYELACGDRYSSEISYKSLLTLLHCTEFTYSVRKDSNRASDGIALRRRFSLDQGTMVPLVSTPGNKCSVLEMILGVAIKCEEIMDDPSVGDRTRQWFWSMITNLGLSGAEDRHFDRGYVIGVLETFLSRKYESDGHGGLFIIPNCTEDLRKVEIWVQMCWYLDKLVY